MKKGCHHCLCLDNLILMMLPRLNLGWSHCRHGFETAGTWLALLCEILQDYRKFQNRSQLVQDPYLIVVMISLNFILPERATISLAVNPLFEKEVIRSLRSMSGDGRSELAAPKLAVVESLLPN